MSNIDGGEYDSRRILLISDTHAPYQHPDTCAFLLGCSRRYQPTMVVHVGDEVDMHAMSFHASDSDLPSAGDELTKAITELYPLYHIFPKMLLVDSNHGSMAMRKAKFHGIPMKYIRTPREVLEAPAGWTWHNELRITLPNGQMLYVCHGVSKDGLKLAQKLGCCVAQGHFHTEFCIKYTSSPSQLAWSIQVGCSIDDKSLAFAYNKTTTTRPIIGHGIVIDGLPKLLPMLLNERGRWNGIIP